MVLELLFDVCSAFGDQKIERAKAGRFGQGFVESEVFTQCRENLRWNGDVIASGVDAETRESGETAGVVLLFGFVSEKRVKYVGVVGGVVAAGLLAGSIPKVGTTEGEEI